LHQSFQFHWFYGGALILLAVMIFAVRRIEKRWADNPYKNLALLAMGAAAFVILQAGFIEPVEYDSTSTKPFIAKVLSFAQPHNSKIVFYRIHPDSEAIQFVVNLETLVLPEFINDFSELSAYPDMTCCITYARDFVLLPKDISGQIHVICDGSIGRKKCVAFTLLESEKP
jgi:hypothetical protein